MLLKDTFNHLSHVFSAPTQFLKLLIFPVVRRRRRAASIELTLLTANVLLSINLPHSQLIARRRMIARLEAVHLQNDALPEAY